MCTSPSRAVHAHLDITERGAWLEEEVCNKADEPTRVMKRRPNPMYIEVNRATFEALRIADAFGLTPSAATKVQATPGATQKKRALGIS